MNTEDSLSDLLRGVALAGWKAGTVACRGAWVTDVRAGAVCCYALRSGSCDLIVPGHEAIRLRPFEACLIPATLAHQLHRAGPHPTCFPDLSEMPCDADRRDSVAVTEIVYGRCPANQFTARTLGLLPAEAVKLSTESHPSLAGAEALVDCIFNEAAGGWPGAQAVIERTAQALFVQVVRAYALKACSSRESPSADRGRQLRAILDPAVGPVLGLIHSQPGEPWTVKGLARRVGMAKSAFSERFRKMLGRPPLQYLTDVRMQKACELLQQSDVAIGTVALVVGYESASSFSNAFKRRVGCGPAEYRQAKNAAANGNGAAHAVVSRPSDGRQRRAVQRQVVRTPA